MRLSVVAQGLIVASLLLLLSAGSAWATTRIVPTQFPTIQAAMVASASSGDTVLVNPGTYHEKVDFLGKEIVLRSASGAATTIIDAAGGGYAPGVFMSGVGQRARLIGFTIKNGTGYIEWDAPIGGGVCVIDGTGSGPLVSDNVITNNSAYYGGGVYARGPSRILRNRIVNNSGYVSAGGIHCGNGAVVSENEIFGNVSQYNDGHAGGASINGGFGPLVEFTRNVVACNEAERGGGCSAHGGFEGVPGVLIEGNTFILNTGRTGVGGCRLTLGANRHLEFRNNVVAFNILGGGIDCQQIGLPVDVTASCNDVWGNGPDFLDADCGPFLGVNNNIREEPVFGVFTGCPAGTNDYCLDDESPLLPENSPPGCGLIGARGLCTQIGIADETPAPEAERNRVTAQPNPFATRTTLVIDLVTPAEIELRITNALGRVVAEENLGSLHAGRHRWTWNGRDAGGRQAPAGVYFTRTRRAVSAVPSASTR
jgi:hypothetical protein